MAMIAANDDAQAMRVKLTKQGGWEEFRKVHVINIQLCQRCPTLTVNIA